MNNQFIITTFFLSTVLSFGQKFSVEKLIIIAGNNKDFCIASPSVQECTHDSYICWVNQLDSVYAIYLRQFFPEEEELLTVHSAMTPQLNPTIAYDPTDEVLRIAWQSQINNHWRLLIREYKNQEFGNTIISSDTLSNSIAPSIGSNGLAWIQDGALVYKNENSEISLIDSLLCSNPQLFPYEYLGDPVIVYEKGDIHSKQIFFAQYIGQHREHLPHWEVKKISNESHCINPKFGTLQGISYQSLEDGIWKIIYPHLYSDELQKTKNKLSNFEHPMMFRYPIPTTRSVQAYTNFFLTFDSDSLQDQEIFIKEKSMYSSGDTLINVSNSNGEDSKPIVAFLCSEDSSKIAIIWEHEEQNKTDIWWAKSEYNPIPGKVQNKPQAMQSFTLFQNHPNPFNNVTIIKFKISEPAFVALEVYNHNGQLVQQLESNFLSEGLYTNKWSAKNNSTGIYFFKLSVNDKVTLKKGLYIK